MIDQVNEKERIAHQFGGLLQQQATQIRQAFARPEEWHNLLATEEAERLAVVIRTTDSGRPLIDLAARLTSRDLRYIFPLLYAAGQKQDDPDKMVNKLSIIIRERACLSLYRFGWHILQETYPDRAVARGMSILCNILTIKQMSATKEQATCPALISDLVAPDSRQLVDSLLKAMAQKKISLSDLVDQFKVNCALSLGREITRKGFSTGVTSFYRDSQRFFSDFLTEAPLPEQVQILKHLFAKDDLNPQDKNAFCQIVYRQFGAPDQNNPVWQEIRPRDRNQFEHWILEAVVGTHCVASPRKAHFYHRYSPLIKSVEYLNKNTLILYFKGFIIADNRQQPHMAFYYNANDLTEIKRAKNQLTDLSFPHRRVEDALKAGSTQGVVALFFDEGIRASRSFLDFALWLNKAASKRTIKNLALRSLRARQTD